MKSVTENCKGRASDCNIKELAMLVGVRCACVCRIFDL